MAPSRTQVTPPACQDEWLSAVQVGKLLGTTATVVRQWAREGRLEHAKFGPQTMRIKRSVVEAFIEASCVTAGAGSR